MTALSPSSLITDSTCSFAFSTISSIIVGTIITEKVIVKKLGRYIAKKTDDLGKTQEIEYLDLQYEEQKKIKEEAQEKRGLKYARITGIIVLVIFIYMLIPGLPLSGMLLDLEQTAYVDQLFGANSYFQDGFTYIVAIFLILTGIAYGIGAKTIKSDKELINKLGEKLSTIGLILVMIFCASQFIAIFKETNIGTVIVAWLTNLLKALPLSGILLIIVSLLIIAIANIFVPASIAKWAMFSPVLVPMMMQVNISPQFTQFIFRAGESMTNGITPLLAYFVVYIAYLNIYNKDSGKTFSIREGISLMVPYLIALSIAWIFITIIWYITGLPLGPGVFATL